MKEKKGMPEVQILYDKSTYLRAQQLENGICIGGHIHDLIECNIDP